MAAARAILTSGKGEIPPEAAARKGLLSLPFMKRAMDKQKREAEEAAAKVLADAKKGRLFEGDFDADDVEDR